MKQLYWPLLFALLLISCGKEVKVAILHTNDNHGEILNMAKIADLKRGLMEDYDTVLLISAGDMFSGNPYVDFYVPKGYPMIDIMNKTGYDFAMLGNHEFDYGQDILNDRIEQAIFPVFCNNIEATNNKLLDNLAKDVTVSIKGIALEFTGLLETDNNGIPSTHPDKVIGLKFIDPLVRIDQLKPEENADYVILVNHLGIEKDSIIATKHPEYEVIIGGHSHTLIKEQKEVNGVLIAQAGHDLNYAGLISLTFKRGKLKEKRSGIIDLNDLPPSHNTLQKSINAYLTNPTLDTSIAIAKTSFKNRVALGKLMTDAQRVLYKTDFAFQNKYGIRIDSLPSGNISKSSIYEMDPFNNELEIFSMSKKDIDALIAYSFNLRGEIDLYMSGGSYEIKTDNNNKISEIKVLDANGNELDGHKLYKVALNSYIGHSYLSNPNLKVVGTSTHTANNIIKYLSQEHEVDYANSKGPTVNSQ